MNNSEIEQCATTLSQLETGYLPEPIFSEIARLVRLPIVLLAPVKKENGKIFIGLNKRGPEERWWPNQWNLPGTILRSTDTMSSALERLLNEEILIAKSTPPIFHTSYLHHSERGQEAIFLHTIEDCEFLPESHIQWFTIDELPDELITSERTSIEEMLKYV